MRREIRTAWPRRQAPRCMASCSGWASSPPRGGKPTQKCAVGAKSCNDQKGGWKVRSGGRRFLPDTGIGCADAAAAFAPKDEVLRAMRRRWVPLKDLGELRSRLHGDVGHPPESPGSENDKRPPTGENTADRPHNHESPVEAGSDAHADGEPAA